MPLFNNWPYMDLSKLNLDWMIKKIKEIEEKIEDPEEFPIKFVTPQMFGAAADGVTDDSAAFAAMFNNAECKLYYVPPGTYRLASPILLSNFSNKTMIGDPYGKSKIMFTGSGYAFNIYGGSDSAIKNITFIGDGTNGGINIADISPNTSACRCNRLRLEEDVFTSCSVGINIDAPTGYIYIDKCSVNTIPVGGYGIKIGSGYANTVTVEPGYIYIQNTNIDDGVNRRGAAGIDISHGVHIYILANDICNFKQGYAIDIHSDVKHIYSIDIMANSIFGNLHGIRVRAVNYFCRLINVSNNQFQIHNGGYAEEYYGTAARRAYAIVSTGSMYFDAGAITDYVKADYIQDLTFKNWQAYTDTNIPKKDYLSFTNITGDSDYRIGYVVADLLSAEITATGSYTLSDAITNYDMLQIVTSGTAIDGALDSKMLMVTDLDELYTKSIEMGAYQSASIFYTAEIRINTATALQVDKLEGAGWDTPKILHVYAIKW